MKDINVFGMRLKRGSSYNAKHLPPALVSGVRLHEGNLGGVPCIAADVETTVRPARFVKLAEMVQGASHRPVLFVCESISAVKRVDLTERGLAWVQDSEVFSIPFVAASCRRRMLRPDPKMLSNASSAIAVRAISGEWIGKTSSEIASLLGKSISSVGNYFRELDAVCPGIIGRRGRTRFLDSAGKTPEELYEAFLPTMARAVVDRRWYRCGSMEGVSALGLPASCISALSFESMLSDNEWTTLAVGPSRKNQLDCLESMCTRVEESDSPDLLIEVWSRDPMVENGRVYGPDLLLDCMEIQAEDDERIEGAIEDYRERILV